MWRGAEPRGIDSLAQGYAGWLSKVTAIHLDAKKTSDFHFLILETGGLKPAESIEER